MLKLFCSIFVYLLIIFRKGIKSSFPCKVSPFFALKRLKGLQDVNLDSAFLGRDVTISSGCCFYEDPIIFGKVRIGRYTSICGPATRICAEINHVYIGAFCSIASNVVIQEYNHNLQKPSTYDVLSHLFDETNTEMVTSKGDIVIEDGVWIGSNSVILSGVHIGRGAVIGAGAVVVNDIPAYAIAVGNPAKVVKYRFSEESIAIIEKSQWWTWNQEKFSINKDFFTQTFK